MPEAFSPSRSLKDCRMTLRTVRASSFSRESALSPRCLGCKCDLGFHVFEAARMRQQPVEELSDRGDLHLRIVERIHARAEHGGVLEALGVPADVLAGHAHAALVAVEG